MMLKVLALFLFGASRIISNVLIFFVYTKFGNQIMVDYSLLNFKTFVLKLEDTKYYLNLAPILTDYPILLFVCFHKYTVLAYLSN